MTKGILVTYFLSIPSFLQGQTATYFSSDKPGNLPLLFARDIISTDSVEHSSPTFSKDGKVVLWSSLARGSNPIGLIYETRLNKGVWLTPYRPSFADVTSNEFYPVFSTDGKTLYFNSKRPLPGNSHPIPVGLRIWKVKRLKNKWGAPAPLDTAIFHGNEYSHSTSLNRTIYFSSPKEGGKGQFDIYFSQFVKGKYQPALPLNDEINTAYYEDGPCISPDGTFLIFESDRPGGIDGSIDLYISFRERDGGWGKPRNMGDAINTKYTERFARLSPDGKYLFFGSTREVKGKLWNPSLFDIYWIDLKIIDALR